LERLAHDAMRLVLEVAAAKVEARGMNLKRLANFENYMARKIGNRPANIVRRAKNLGVHSNAFNTNRLAYYEFIHRKALAKAGRNHATPSRNRSAP